MNDQQRFEQHAAKLNMDLTPVLFDDGSFHLYENKHTQNAWLLWQIPPKHSQTSAIAKELDSVAVAIREYALEHVSNPDGVIERAYGARAAALLVETRAAEFRIQANKELPK